MPIVSSLFIYPVKSCKGISQQVLTFDRRGPVLDRHWMVVDEQGEFLTQRTQPRLASIQPELDGARLRLTAPNFNPFEVPEAAAGTRRVRVWDFSGEAEDLGDAAADWLARVLREPVRLVRFAPSTHRLVSRDHTSLDAEVAFSDGYPALLLSLESLVELNRRLPTPLPMNRFRPNVVVRDCQPFEEDTWRHLRAPELELSVVKPCERCVITTIDQDALERTKEPLRTLARFRRTEHGVIFGQNCVHHGPGTLRVGDEFEVASRGPAPELLS